MDNAKIGKETKAKLKGKETWITNYDNHEIKIVNKLKVTMYIDGIEVAKQKGIVSTNVTLCANIPDTDKFVVATLRSSGNADDVLIDCRILIGEQAELIHGFTTKDGAFEALSAEEEKQYIQIMKERNESLNDSVTVSVITNL